MFNKLIVEISGNLLHVVGCPCHPLDLTTSSPLHENLHLIVDNSIVRSFLNQNWSIFRHSSLILWETRFNNNWHCSSSLFIIRIIIIHCGQSIKPAWEWDPSQSAVSLEGDLWVDKSESGTPDSETTLQSDVPLSISYTLLGHDAN